MAWTVALILLVRTAAIKLCYIDLSHSLRYVLYNVCLHFHVSYFK